MPLQMTSISINDGELASVQMLVPGDPPRTFPVSLAGQISVVRHLQFRFNVPVEMDAGAVSIAPHPGVNVLAGTLAPNQLPVSVDLSPLPGSGGQVWIGRFSGPGVESGNGVLKQGVYDVVVDPAKIHAGPMTADPVPAFTFATMFGGATATGTIVRCALDPNLAANFGASLANPGGPPPYSVAVDRNLDGHVDGIDKIHADQAAGSIWVY